MWRGLYDLGRPTVPPKIYQMRTSDVKAADRAFMRQSLLVDT